MKLLSLNREQNFMSPYTSRFTTVIPNERPGGCQGEDREVGLRTLRKDRLA
jgi:hypothetical protein